MKVEDTGHPHVLQVTVQLVCDSRVCIKQIVKKRLQKVGKTEDGTGALSSVWYLINSESKGETGRTSSYSHMTQQSSVPFLPEAMHLARAPFSPP